jgi:arylsulfatase A-like enzyme
MHSINVYISQTNKPKWYRFYYGLILLASMLWSCEAEQNNNRQAAQRPNILIIQVDDLGYDDLALHNNPYLSTPNLDRLGEESVRFERFYVNAVCAPTRASLPTGQHFLRTGVSHVHGGKDYLSKAVPTLGDHFTAAGYVTGMWGKWHSGNAEGYYPWQRGFQEAYMSKLYQHRNGYGYMNGQLQAKEQWADETLVDYALSFMEQHRDTSFLAYVSSMTCHEPLDAPASAKQHYLDQGLPEGLSTLYGMIHHFDRQIGRLLAGMTELGLMDNTVILFMSDNGPAVNNRALTDAERDIRKVNGFKGWKGNLWENGLRSPLFVKWGAKFSSGVRKETVDVTDVLPTLLDLAGITSPDSIDFDGQSFRPLLEGQKSVAWDNTHIDFVQPGWQPTDTPWTPEGVLDEYAPVETQKASIDWSVQPIAVISDGYKLIRNPGPAEGYLTPTPDRVLFHLPADQTEDRNLVDSLHERASAMDGVAQQWFQGIQDSPHAFQAPMFRVLPDTVSAVPLYAPREIDGGLKIAFNFLHQLKAGGIATYKIDVEAPGDYHLTFDKSDLRGTYRIQTALGGSAILNGNGIATLTMEAGSQLLSVEVIESGDKALKYFKIEPTGS